MAQELEQYTHEDLVNFFICEKKKKKKKTQKNTHTHTHTQKEKNKKIGVDANKVGGLCLFFFFFFFVVVLYQLQFVNIMLKYKCFDEIIYIQMLRTIVSGPL